MNIILAQPRGFCAGVVRAIQTVEQALAQHSPPIYVLHEIVHNRHVVENLKQRGALFVENIQDIPSNSICIFSAHGVANHIAQQAKQRQLKIIDATCPLVKKVHSQAQRYQQQGYEIIIIGHSGHPEVEGTRGCISGNVHVLCTKEAVSTLTVQNPQKLAYVTQTTLSLDDTQEVIKELIRLFPTIQGPALTDICYATQNRQNAVRELASQVDVLLVVGAHNSSNSNRLREVGAQAGVSSYLIEDAEDLQPHWFIKTTRIGITAGASTPEVLIEGVLDRLRTLGITEITTLPGKIETTTFQLPILVD